MHFWPWQQTVDHYKRGIAVPSIALEYLEKDENLDTVRDASGMMYSAGTDNVHLHFDLVTTSRQGVDSVDVCKLYFANAPPSTCPEEDSS